MNTSSVDSTPKIQQVRIAELHVASSGLLKAILGSCVAIALINRRTGVCGLAHCLLPVAPEGAVIDNARYADRAIGNLLKLVCDGSSGNPSSRRDLKAFLCGGSRMMRESHARTTVGEMNVASARASFEAHRIRFTEMGVGGTEGSTVVLDCDQKTLVCETIEVPTGEVRKKPRAEGAIVSLGSIL